jgi:hypothetical protein
VKFSIFFKFSKLKINVFSSGFSEWICKSLFLSFIDNERKKEELLKFFFFFLLFFYFKRNFKNLSFEDKKRIIFLFESKGMSKEDAIDFVEILSKNQSAFVDKILVEKG